MIKAVFAMTNLFFWVAFSVNAHKGKATTSDAQKFKHQLGKRNMSVSQEREKMREREAVMSQPLV